MTPRLASAMALLCLSTPLFAGAPLGQTAAATVQHRTAPAYPGPAANAGISGDVRADVTIGEDGALRGVQIRSVPGAGMGFDESVTEALRDWRFTAARRGDTPVESVLELTIPFRLFLQGDYAFRVSPSEAWRQVNELAASLGYKASRRDEEHLLLITRPGRYAAKLMPRAAELGLPEGTQLDEVGWFIGVAPGFTSARVTVSSALTVRLEGSRTTVYRNEPLAIWFRDRLAAQMGVEAERLSDRVTERTQAWPPSAAPGSVGCRPADSDVVASVGGSARPQLTLPRVLFQMKPFFPGGEMEHQQEGTVLLSATVTEHGSVTKLGLLQPREVSPGFLRNAIAAASMWRFSPGTRNGCPVPVTISIEMRYMLR